MGMHLNMEISHLNTVAEIARQMGVDPEQVVPATFPKPLLFKSQVDYVRQILATQVDYNAFETEIGPPDKLTQNPRYEQYQSSVNAGGAPTEEIIERNRSKNGRDYRQELSGEHPVKELRQKK